MGVGVSVGVSVSVGVRVGVRVGVGIGVPFTIPSLATKTSSAPLWLLSKAPDEVGKSVEEVAPVTKALPALSIAIPAPESG